MERFQTIAEEWAKIAQLLRKECEEWLANALKENNGSIDCMKDNSDGFEAVCVTYDGGNHPEYDANPYAVVNSVYLAKDGKILLDIDECSDYELGSVDTDEVYYLCNFIKENVLN